MHTHTQKDQPMNLTAAENKYLTMLIYFFFLKVKIFRKLEIATLVNRLSEQFNIGLLIIYDLKQQKYKMLLFYTNSNMF